MGQQFEYQLNQPIEGLERSYFTVKELTQRVKKLVEEGFSLLWVEGEISNLRHAQNRNLYFNLTEEEASIKAIIFNDQKDREIVSYLQNGLKVLCWGKLNFYPKTGEVYLIVRRIELLGNGYIEFKKQQLIKKYQHLFAPDRKKSIPSFPKKIAVITSIFSAALQDFLKIASERWEIEVLVYPSRVQGEGSEKEIVQAIKDINLHFYDVDVIFITRGGGSAEDLAPFNTEEIILGISESKIPVVSAVGHEIDYTLCDMIADKRCPTPSAAAQEVIPDKHKWLEKLEHYKKKYKQFLDIILSKKQNKLYQIQLALTERSPFNLLHSLEKDLKQKFYRLNVLLNEVIAYKERKVLNQKISLRRYHPAETLQREFDRLQNYRRRLELSFENYFQFCESRMNSLKSLLASLSPLNILERGYSIVRKLETKKVVRSIEEVQVDEVLEVKLSKGSLLVKVLKTEE
ncbi:exodeoxyribonuclease VII large subunit [Thermodesulfobacterium hveragerdense]|uniref:exodeoxyribonuclease VII large subunit n=1 Tax=Thermodesulfobacterium hveragerdense TaxID=53424 RepID=UPI0003F86D69|nr:exodeoxyribonuclease VII large subunit [Thermodesulfobacterium hveragerdense]